MPEYPEIFVFARDMRKELVGRTIRVRPLDDGWRLGSLDTGQLEAAAGVAAQRLRWEGGLEGLDLILSQYIDISLNELAGLCALGREMHKGPLPGMGTTLCDRDPQVHLKGDCYSILTGMHGIGCVGKNGELCEVQGIGETRGGQHNLTIMLLLCWAKRKTRTRSPGGRHAPLACTGSRTAGMVSTLPAGLLWRQRCASELILRRMGRGVY